MENAQLALLFVCGFVLSRLLVKARVPEHLVGRLFHHELSVSKIVLYLVALSAFLSVLIPNAITAITLIPVVLLMRQKLIEHDRGDASSITTALALAVIYGANIGGIGSITATPANGLLVAYAALKRTPDQGLLRFDGWLLWGLPLTAVLVLLAWRILLACLPGVRWSQRAGTLNETSRKRHPALGVSVRLTLAFFAVSFLLSAAMQATATKGVVLAVTIVFAATFVAFVFGSRKEIDGHRRPLLTLDDCVGGLPWRGLGVVAIVVFLAAVAGLFGVIERAAILAAQILPAELGTLSAFTWVALLTSFATQFMSNTVVQLALFEMLNLHPGTGGLTIYLLLVVTLSCTCAFMTPIATGVNGLVYGELKGTSLWRMLVTGAVMNLVAAIVIAGWVFFLVARS